MYKHNPCKHKSVNLFDILKCTEVNEKKEYCIMGREVITLSVGQCGVALGHSVWMQYCMEHSINKDGSLERKDDISFKNIFDEIKTGKYIARNVSIDLDPNGIDVIKNSEYAGLYDQNSLLTHFEDAGGIFARGFFSVGIQAMYKWENQLRKVAERCHNINGFVMINSVGGGTGSGLGSRILETLGYTYRKKARIGFHVFSSINNNNTVTPYNELMAVHYMLDYTDISLVFDNEGVNNICQNQLNIKEPTCDNLNRLISRSIASFTLSPRTESYTTGLRDGEYYSSLIPFPRLHFMIPSMTPIKLLDNQKNISIQEMTEKCLNPDNFLIQLDNLLRAIFALIIL